MCRKLSGIIEKLSNILNPKLEAQDADAAVALILKIENQDTEVFFVKRAEYPGDPYSGQIALPGGKRHLEDKNLKQTVVRETLEETNVNLLESCRFLGTMDVLESTLSPKMNVLPFVALLIHEPLIKLNNELQDYIWIPIGRLYQHESTAKFSFGMFPAYIVDSIVIWGLTYRILKKLINVFKPPQ